MTNNTSTYYIIAYHTDDIGENLRKNYYLKFDTLSDAEKELRRPLPPAAKDFNIYEVKESKIDSSSFSYQRIETKKEEPVATSKDIPVKTESSYIIADKNNNVAEFISDLAKGLHIINKPNYRDCKVLRMVTHFYEISEEDITNAKKEAFEKEVAELKKKYDIKE